MKAIITAALLSNSRIVLSTKRRTRESAIGRCGAGRGPEHGLEPEGVTSWDVKTGKKREMGRATRVRRPTGIRRSQADREPAQLLVPMNTVAATVGFP